MTVSSTNTKNSYSGDGSTAEFNYTFKLIDDDDITVIIRTNATGDETVKSKGTHYTVTGVGNDGGGAVTFTAGNTPASTETVVLLRDTAQTQTTDYTPNDPFPASSHESALDKVTFLAQEIQESLTVLSRFPEQTLLPHQNLPLAQQTGLTRYSRLTETVTLLLRRRLVLTGEQTQR